MYSQFLHLCIKPSNYKYYEHDIPLQTCCFVTSPYILIFENKKASRYEMLIVGSPFNVCVAFREMTAFVRGSIFCKYFKHR